MAKGSGKEEASSSVMQPQGAGGVTEGARCGRAETLGRSRRLMLMMGRRGSGGEKKDEEEGRRRREERWSRMEGGGDAASGASLKFHFGGSGALSLLSPPFLLS